MKERRKFGLKKARKAPQWSKRWPISRTNLAIGVYFLFDSEEKLSMIRI